VLTLFALEQTKQDTLKGRSTVKKKTEKTISTTTTTTTTTTTVSALFLLS
jgi:hypothetical protein